MTNLRKVIVLCVLMFALVAFTSITKSYAPVKAITLDSNPIVIPEVEIVAKEVTFELKGHDDFLYAIGHRESGNRYNVVNSYGYMGKYQFGKSTLKGLGFKISKEEFLNNPYIQEQAMQKLLQHNKKKLQKFIDKYEGEVLHGVYITESGVLAAAHIAGQGNVKKFFRKGYEFTDGYGTKMTSYMNKFSGYNLDL